MKITIQHVIDKLIEPVGLLEDTVDTLLFGDPQTEAIGIVTAFMPTQRVLERALALRANFAIVHEDPFYHHRSSAAFARDVLFADPVYAAKRALIAQSGLALFRFHDYWHRYRPDGVTAGLITALEWNAFVRKHEPVYAVVEVPVTTVYETAQYVKRKLGAAFVRVAGAMEAPCSRVALLSGYRGGGRLAIPLFERENVDLIIYGEGPEWETPEYVRDAARQGRSKALIVLGHAQSEEPGMKALANRLRRLFPDIPVHFVAERPVFHAL